MKLQCGINGVPRWFGGKKPTPKTETGGAEKAEPHFHPNIISLAASFVEDEDASRGGAVLGQLC